VKGVVKQRVLHERPGDFFHSREALVVHEEARITELRQQGVRIFILV
jgi:hypothetical protein